MANQIEDKYFIKTTINVRGKSKSYYAFEKNVILDKVGVVKLVISKRKKDRTTKYIISTNKDLSSKEIISIYEDRWDIETAHRETNQKLGFKVESFTMGPDGPWPIKRVCSPDLMQQYNLLLPSKLFLRRICQAHKIPAAHAQALAGM